MTSLYYSIVRKSFVRQRFSILDNHINKCWLAKTGRMANIGADMSIDKRQRTIKRNKEKFSIVCPLPVSNWWYFWFRINAFDCLPIGFSFSVVAQVCYLISWIGTINSRKLCKNVSKEKITFSLTLFYYLGLSWIFIYCTSLLHML